MLVICATVASLFPFVGTILYVIVRPPEYLEDIHERELEMQAAEARLHEANYMLCPHCDYEVKEDFLRCPNCMRKLRDPCRDCGRPLDPDLEALPVLRGRARRRRTPAAAALRSLTAPNSEETTTPMDRTLILVKPDAFARGLTGEIIARFERKGLTLAALKLMTVDEEHRQAPLRRARGQAVLRRPRRLHHLGPARRDDPRGPERGRRPRASSSARRTARGGARLDPRRLRASRCGATSSTARTPTSPPSARSRSSSATVGERAAAVRRSVRRVTP